MWYTFVLIMCYTLKKHQEMAVDKFMEHYYGNGNDRGILSMCCGSGKTFVFYNILLKCMKKYNEKIFVYATSRILLIHNIVKDIVHWAFYDNICPVILIKVSDFSMKNLRNDILNGYKNNKIVYDKLNIFLKKYAENIIVLDNNCDKTADLILEKYKNNTIIMITTYDSIHHISKAMTIPSCKNMAVDLIVFDESHNLAGDSKKKVSKILEGEQEEEPDEPDEQDEQNEETYKIFRSNKFLFMTATPLAITKQNKKSSYANREMMFSMDKEHIFGKIFYEYSFAEAIVDGIISNFEVIYLDDRSDCDGSLQKIRTEITDPQQQQRLYFTFLSKYLISVVLNYNLKHTIVYISNQAKLEVFRDILSDVIGYVNISVLYVMSSQSNSEKHKNINEFREYNGLSKILLSVDIFNEGIDIPICDSILFAEERFSETVIVQNIGRALRISKHKTKAYVILPTKIYNPDSDAVFSSTFKKTREICDVLKSKIKRETKYFSRYAKNSAASFTNKNDDPDIDHRSEMVDDVIRIKRSYSDSDSDSCKDDGISEKDMKKIDGLSSLMINSMEILSTNGSISGMQLREFTTMIRKCSIVSLDKLHKKSMPIIKTYPHKYFAKEWICYGDLMFDEVLTYDESVSFIKTLDLSQVNCVMDWYEFYDGIVEKCLRGDKNGMGDIDMSVVYKLIRVPYRPRSYYKEDWIKKEQLDETIENKGWNTFLNKNFNNVGTENVSCASVGSNSEKNLKNVLNDDGEKVNTGVWKTFENYLTDTTGLKKHIDKKFKIDSQIFVRYMANDTYREPTRIAISAAPRGFRNAHGFSPPILTKGNNLICYDKNVFNNSPSLRSAKISRSEKYEINDEIIHNIIFSIKKEVHKFTTPIRDTKG